MRNKKDKKEIISERGTRSGNGRKNVFLTACIIGIVLIFVVYTSYKQEHVGASDWYGYYSLSLLLKQGRADLEVSVPADKFKSIAPLSYRADNGKVLPQYPPGYPLLMAMAGWIGLEFHLTPFLGVLSIILMFLLIRDMTDNMIAAIFSLLWAFSPIVVYGSTTIMSDLTATVFILLSLYFYRKKKIVPSALSLGYSLVVRPTNILYCLIFLPLMLKREQALKKRWKYCFYVAIPVLLYGIYNWKLFGVPWQTGYMNVSDELLPSVFFSHLVFYLKEIAIQFSPFLIVSALPVIWRKNRDSLFYACWFLIFLIFYCFWKSGGDKWWWTRFLLPAFAALFFLAALGLKDMLVFIRSKWKSARIQTAVSTLLIVLTCIIIFYYIHYGFNHGDIWEKEKGKIYYDVSKAISAAVPADSFVGAIEYSGPIKLYTDLETFNTTGCDTIFLILYLLKNNKNVYIAVESWNRCRPRIKKIFRYFRVKDVMILAGDPNFLLYKVTKHRKKHWKQTILGATKKNNTHKKNKQ